MRYVATRVCASVNEWCGRDGSGCGWWPVRGPKPRCARRSAGDSTLSRVVRDTDARVCGHTEKSPRMSTRPSVRVRRAGASSGNNGGDAHPSPPAAPKARELSSAPAHSTSKSHCHICASIAPRSGALPRGLHHRHASIAEGAARPASTKVRSPIPPLPCAHLLIAGVLRGSELLTRI